MKINVDKIKKYQVGGSIIYQPVPTPQFKPMMLPPQGQPEQQAAAAGAQQTGPLSDDIVKELLGKGLTNDVMAFSTMVNEAYKQYESLSDLEKSSIMGQRLRNVMKGDLGQLNNLRRNKDLLTGAISKVEGNNAGSDFAVTERGMIIKDLESGRIAEVTAEQFASEGGERFKILTNAELINEREYNPNLVNDAKSIQALNSAVGMNGVREEIRTVLSNLGEVSSGGSDQKYIFKGGAINSKEMAVAIQQLVGQGADGFYKAGNSNSSTSNAKNIEIAAEAMWINMSSNSKSLLKARAAANGISADQLEDAAKEYAVALLRPSIKDKQQSDRTIDYDSQMTEDFAKSTGAGKDDKLTGNIGFYAIGLDLGGTPTNIQINSGTNTTMNVVGFRLPGLQTGGKAVPSNTMLRDVPEISQFADFESVTMGGMKIRRDQLNAIMYEGGESATVEMPFIKNGNTITPDTKLNERYVAAEKDIKAAGGDRLSFAMRSQIYQKHGFRIKNDGKPDINLAKFLTFTGKINENSFDTGVKLDQTFLRKVSSGEQNEYKEKYLKDKDGKTLENTDWGSWVPFSNSDVYRGQVYIHFTAGAKEGVLIDGMNIKVPKFNTSMNYLSSSNTQRQLLNQQSDALNSKYQYPE